VEHLLSKEYLEDLILRYSLEITSHLGLLDVIGVEKNNGNKGICLIIIPKLHDHRE
jgi:hypothetical protein